NAEEVRYVLNEKNQEIKSSLFAQNLLPLKIDYVTEKTKPLRIKKVFIPLITIFEHDYIYDESGLLVEKNMRAKFKDGTNQIFTNNVTSFYNEIINNLNGIHRINIKFDTESGQITQIQKRDIKGELYGWNAKVTAKRDDDNDSYKYTYSFENGNEEQTRNYVGCLVEIYSVNKKTLDVNKIGCYDRSEKDEKIIQSNNKNGVHEIAFTYDYKPSSNSKIIKSHLRYNKAIRNVDEINYNPTKQSPFETYTYNQEGFLIEERYTNDLSDYGNFFYSFLDSVARITYELKNGNKGIHLVIQRFKNNSERISSEYGSFLDSIKLNSLGLVMESKSYRLPDFLKNEVSWGYRYKYDTLSRVTEEEDLYNKSKYIITYNEVGGAQRYSRTFNQNDSLLIEFFKENELTGREYCKGNTATPIESYEGSKVSGYFYEWDSKGRMTEYKERIFDDKNDEFEFMINSNTFKDFSSEIHTSTNFRKNIKDQLEKIENEYDNSHRSVFNYDQWNNKINEQHYTKDGKALYAYIDTIQYDKSGNIKRIQKFENGNIFKTINTYNFEWYGKFGVQETINNNNNTTTKIENKYNSYGDIILTNDETFFYQDLQRNNDINLFWGSDFNYLKRDFDDNKNCVKISFYKGKEKAKITNGIHSFKFHWELNDSLKRWEQRIQAAFDIDDKQVKTDSTSDYFFIQFEYDKNWNIVNESYYKNPSKIKFGEEENTNGKGYSKVNDVYGVHSYSKNYNEDYITTSEEFEDSYNKPTVPLNFMLKNNATKYGVSKYEVELKYNDDYETDTTVLKLFNKNGQLFLAHDTTTKAYIKYEYDYSDERKALFKDEVGNPIKDKSGVSGWIEKKDTNNNTKTRTNIDENGKEIISKGKDGFSKIIYYFGEYGEYLGEVKYKKNKVMFPIKIGKSNIDKQ
ncbi:MAG: hypothetical protein ACKO7P_07980, partial [Bacteroidota bacterium]